MNQLTPLQAALEPRMLQRGYSDTLARLYPAFERYGDVHGFEAELLRRAFQSGEWDPEITVLEVGCGVGNAIEEVVRVMPPYLWETFKVRLRIKGIGVDINPLPHLISKNILQISPRTGYKTKKPSRVRTDFRKDDAMTLATIPDESVDVLFASNCLAYLPDPLRAVETGWRVLKPDGIMVWWTGLETLEKPTLREVLRNTPGASDLFKVMQCSHDLLHDDSADDTLIGRKKGDTPFRGFPYKLRDSYQFRFNREKESARDFAYHCTYDYDEDLLRRE